MNNYCEHRRKQLIEEVKALDELEAKVAEIGATLIFSFVIDRRHRRHRSCGLRLWVVITRALAQAHGYGQRLCNY